VHKDEKKQSAKLAGHSVFLGLAAKVAVFIISNRENEKFKFGFAGFTLQISQTCRRKSC